MPIIIFLFMNLIVMTSSFFITYRLLKLSNFIDSLLCWFIAYFAQIVFSELLLGVLGILYLKNVILLNLTVLLIIWLIVKDRQSSFDTSAVNKLRHSWRGRIWPLKYSASQGTQGFSPGGLHLSGVKDSVYGLLENKIIRLSCCAILGFAVIKIFINLINPPFGWDDLNYHFTFPVEWLKHGNLVTPIIISDDPSPSYYPIGGSLFYLWFMLPLRNVFLADLGQVPFFILAFLAVYNISRKINQTKELSFYAAAVFLLIPNFFKQLEIAYVDIMVAALFLVCLNYLFLLGEDFSIKNVLIFSMGLGLLLGTKTVAIPYSLLLYLPFLYLFCRNINKPRPFYNEEEKQGKKEWGKSYLFFVSICTIVTLGGFSYIRNFLQTKNPLYPLDFSLFGKTFFKGVMDMATYRAHFKIADYRLGKLLFHEGLGIQTLIFILPSIFLALPLTLFKKIRQFNFNLLYFLILPLLIYLVYRYIIPLANVRYLYPLLGVGIILGFYSIGILDMPPKIIKILVVLCILVSIFEISKQEELGYSMILTFLLFIPSSFLIRYIKHKILIRKPLSRRNVGRGTPFVFLFLILVFYASRLLEENYIRNEYSRYTKMVKYSGFWLDATKAWEWLNKNTAGNNIAYVGRPVPFPLYGTNFKNNVYYVSVNKTEPAKLHYFRNSSYHWGYDFLSLHKNLEAEGNYRSNADYSIWLNNLFKKNTDFLFIYSLHQTEKLEFPLEDEWAKDYPDKFTPVFTNDTIHIYKLTK